PRGSGSPPVLREAGHDCWRRSGVEKQREEWLLTRKGWRPHVLNFALGVVRDGLQDRAFTRDLDWGIPIPVDDIGEGKSIYVWWEAVMGYYSAPPACAQRPGDPDTGQQRWD